MVGDTSVLALSLHQKWSRTPNGASAPQDSVSLAEARAKALECRKLHEAGIPIQSSIGRPRKPRQPWTLRSL